MGMTMTQKILAKAAGLNSVKAGDLIMAKLSLVLGNDITAPVAIREFDKLGVNGVFDKKKVALVPDHFTPNKDIKSAEQARTTTDTYITNYKAVVNEFGITRQLGQSEKNYIDKWSKTYGFNIELIKKACSKTLLSIQKPDFKYTDKILTAWHQKNVRSLEDLEDLENNYQKNQSSKKTKPYSTPKTNNKFNSFSQRNYTYEEIDELERKLLSK